jgi:hypothetical protein
LKYPQLTGGAPTPPTSHDGRLIIGIVVALATIIGGLAWANSTESEDPGTPAVAPSPSPQQPPTAVPAVRPAHDAQERQLHLAHAEQELIRAAEQLAQARRTLAALSPALSRNYLTTEKRRLDSAWSACDWALRSVEQARGDIAMFKAAEKEQP